MVSSLVRTARAGLIAKLGPLVAPLQNQAPPSGGPRQQDKAARARHDARFGREFGFQERLGDSAATRATERFAVTDA